MKRRNLFWLVALVVQAAFAQQTVEVHLPSMEPHVQLAGWWTPAKPQLEGRPKPAVVALHGCSGPAQNKRYVSWPDGQYVRLLNGLGIGVLYIDSFGPRGVESICSLPRRQRTVDETNRRLDTYGALQWLSTQPGVDAQRLGVIGFSHGGQTVLSAANQTEDVVRHAPIKPKVLVAYYPGCNGPESMFRYESVAPLLIMTGAIDDWTPPVACRRLVERLHQDQPGQTVRYIEYPDSYHAFDSIRPPAVRDNVAGTKSGKATVGGNPAAREASAKALTEFLIEQFKLEPTQ
ncbi:MAG: dienelactone hydrolase family protein [Rhodoferax sp.]|nr:dienelactone hydrolase family protein [Rhodoferax sp.]